VNAKGYNSESLTTGVRVYAVRFDNFTGVSSVLTHRQMKIYVFFAIISTATNG